MSIKNFCKWFFKDLSKDNKHNYHTSWCRLRDKNFTVIENNRGLKVWESKIKYCPCCGAELRD